MTPITLRLNFSLVGMPIPSSRNLRPMLAVDAQRYFTASVSPGVGVFQKGWRVRTPYLGETLFCLSFQLPFEKNCGMDHVCQDDLAISFGVSG